MTDSEFWHHDGPDFEPVVWSPPVITGKLTQHTSFAGEEFAYARARATRPVKVTLPSATVMLTYWSPEHSPAAYASPKEALADFGDILHAEVKHLADLGCQHIQVDAPDLTMLLEKGTSFFFEAAGFTRTSYIEEALNLLNGVADVPGVTFSVHLCRGNKQNEYHSSGGYEAISKEVFPKLTKFDYVLLEFDDERSGGFEPLTDMPDDTCVVLGLVSTKTTEVEVESVLEARIDEAAKFHPRDQLAVSPQCGFASLLVGNLISDDVEEAKLDVVGDLARSAWA